MSTSQNGSGSSGGIFGVIALIIVIGVSTYYRTQKTNDEAARHLQTELANKAFDQIRERQKQQEAAFQDSLHDHSEPAPPADVARWNGKRVKVSNPAYFAAFGGVPAFSQWKDAAQYPFTSLANAQPGTAPQPTSFEKDFLTSQSSAKMLGVTFLPVTTEFDVLDVRLSKPQFGAPQLICQVRPATNPAKEYYVHTNALTVAP